MHVRVWHVGTCLLSISNAGLSASNVSICHLVCGRSAVGASAGLHFQGCIRSLHVLHVLPCAIAFRHLVLIAEGGGQADRSVVRPHCPFGRSPTTATPEPALPEPMQESLSYIKGLDIDDAEVYLQKYGKMLLGHLPEVRAPPGPTAT